MSSGFRDRLRKFTIAKLGRGAAATGRSAREWASDRARPAVPPPPTNLRSRLVLVRYALGLGLFVIIARLFQVQVLGHESYAARATAQQERRVTLPAARGDVLDRQGRVLLHTLACRTLVARPNEIQDAGVAAKALAPVCKRPAAELKRLLSGKKAVVELDPELDEDQWNRLRTLHLAGIRVEEAGRRMKLMDGADFLGAVNKDGIGDEGIECAMESSLKGVVGWETRYTDARGKETGLSGSASRPSVEGDQVVLTIDADLQWIVEDALAQATAEHEARGGSAVLVEVETGEVLALAAVGAKGLGEGRRANRIAPIEDTFEPGSTFKIVTFAAALERGLIDDNAVFFAENGRARFGPCEIRDVKKMGWLCAPDVLAQSSNIATAKIGELVGANDLYAMAGQLGFGRRTHIELPGEVAGILRPVSEWSGRSVPTVSIGQEVAVTSLQLAMAYGAIANGGELMRPRLVKEVVRADGTVRARSAVEVVRRAMSEETAATLRRYLTRVVDTGTGKRAQIPGVAVAGKTGTAQKARTDGRGYATGRFVSSFIGFFPADRPRYVLAISIDEPAGMHYGGEVAAPVFRQIATAMLGPAHEFDGLRLVAADAEVGNDRPSRLTVPDVRLMTPTAAVEALDRAGFEPTMRGEQGARVLGQDPAPGTKVARGAVIRMSSSVADGNSLPDLRGLSLREALSRLRGVGVEARVDGVGRVAEQSPAPGAAIAPGLVCRLKLNSVLRGDSPAPAALEASGEVPSVLASASLGSHR
jgi:cell division protein FtsI (penicillin-binding protein 3)